MKTSSHKPKSNNAEKPIFTKEDKQELQGQYLRLAYLEYRFTEILLEMGILGDDEAIKKAIDAIQNEDARNALKDFLNARTETCNHDPLVNDQLKEMAEWAGVTPERMGQIEREAYDAYRKSWNSRSYGDHLNAASYSEMDDSELLK